MSKSSLVPIVPNRLGLCSPGFGTPVPDRSGTGVPKPGEHSPKRLGTIGTRLDFDIILTDICPTLCLTPEHI